jgi:hypothetical protein
MFVYIVDSSFSFFGNALLYRKLYDFLLAIKLTDAANTSFKSDSLLDDCHCMQVQLCLQLLDQNVYNNFTETFFILAF